jgi:hypothetical protein
MVDTQDSLETTILQDLTDTDFQRKFVNKLVGLKFAPHHKHGRKLIEQSEVLRRLDSGDMVDEEGGPPSASSPSASSSSASSSSEQSSDDESSDDESSDDDKDVKFVWD